MFNNRRVISSSLFSITDIQGAFERGRVLIATGWSITLLFHGYSVTMVRREGITTAWNPVCVCVHRIVRGIGTRIMGRYTTIVRRRISGVCMGGL